MEEQNTKREQEIAEGDNNSIKSNSSNRPKKLPNPKRMMSLADQTNIGSAMQLDKPVQKSILKKSFGSQAQISESTADIRKFNYLNLDFLDNMKSSIAAMKSSFGVSQSSDPNAQSDNQHRSYRKDRKPSLDNVKEDVERLPFKVQLRQKEPIPEKSESLDYMTSNLQSSPDSIRKEAKPAELQTKPLERIAHSKVLIPLSPISTESTSLKPYNRLSVAQSPTTHSPLSSEPCSPSIKDNASAQSLGIDDDNSYDRGYPTANNQFGVAEVLFGTVLGTLRSEELVDFTTFVMSPQLMDPVIDSSTIIGAGYSANVSTTCSCSPGITASDFEKWGLDTSAAILVSDSVNSSPAFSLVTYLNQTEGKIGLSNVLTVQKVCGGSQSNSAIFYPTCYTEITDFRHATVLAAYMTDGTPASISIKSSDVVESLEPANMSRLYNALHYMYGGKITSQILPSTFPSAINPLMWWTTTNTQTISPPLLSAGMETLHSILLRSSILRYFSIKGTKCESRVISENSVTLRIGPSGYIFGLFFAGTDIFLAFLSIAMAVPWLFSSRLISPAVRIATNRLYFQLMVCSNPNLYGGFVTSFDMLDFWVKLDLMGKVGESKDTIDDEEYGKIALNKPKLVRPFQTGKLYN
ncbi:hypothetical protein HDV02_006605 [Globomyces sp. JEL0801]|nr:hypothetical protein HDV02_006605 [Globomyces sp. JEL0801]